MSPFHFAVMLTVTELMLVVDGKSGQLISMRNLIFIKSCLNSVLHQSLVHIFELGTPDSIILVTLCWQIKNIDKETIKRFSVLENCTKVLAQFRQSPHKLLKAWIKFIWMARCCRWFCWIGLFCWVMIRLWLARSLVCIISFLQDPIKTTFSMTF